MKINRERYLIVVAFVATALFFGLAYPYHLMRREQMTLFIYDIPYLLRTYGCVGGISTLIGDFVEQFYCIKIIGPIVVSTLLTTIGILSYRITRNFVGPKVSLGIAALLFFWSFLRETETRFLTQYTISFLGYLLCIYTAMNFKDTVSKVCALFSFLMIGTVLFGTPYHKNYGKLIGKPDFDYEKLIAMDIEASNEDWDKVLEISSKSLQPYGDALSAFYLCKYVPSLERSVPVEVIYQAAKTFKNGGPFLDLLEGSSRSAKKDERLKTSGDLISFTFEDQTYPIFPRTAFYDYLYVNALMENETLADEVLKYDAFTDIEFNPNKGVNCQARAAAMFVSLHRLGRLSEVKSFDTFLALYKGVR